MFKLPIVCRILLVCLVNFHISGAESKEYSLEASIDARAEYNDNIFLTDLPHNSTKGIIVTPSLAGVIKEENWEGQLQAGLRIRNYSDESLSGTDQLFDLSGQYNHERNIYSLNINHYIDSNLNSTSQDFGTVIGRRVDRKSQSITPQYTRLLSERLVLRLSYTYSDVDYLNAENTGFTPYILQVGSGTLVYDLTSRDKLTFSLTAIDYISSNELVTYQLFQSRVSIAHSFSQTLSADFLIGVSRRNSTNLQSQTFDFFGRPITVEREIDSESRGLIFDVGVIQLFETSRLEGRVSRDDTTNSFGGVDATNEINIKYAATLSGAWRYSVTGRYDDITSISSGTTRTSRKVLTLRAAVFYSINRKWRVNASYQYATRRFDSDPSDNRAPDYNTISVGLTYNFPSLSTF